jgi:hypothetical protein
MIVPSVGSFFFVELLLMRVFNLFLASRSRLPDAIGQRGNIMIKNILIIFMIYIIGSLLIAKPDNMEVLKQSIFSTKEFIGNGYNNYIENNSRPTS